MGRIFTKKEGIGYFVECDLEFGNNIGSNNFIGSIDFIDIGNNNFIGNINFIVIGNNIGTII